MGRGYSFEFVRAMAMVLYDEDANNPTTSTISKKVRKPSDSSGTFRMTYEVGKQQKATMNFGKKYYGAHIPTLCGLLEQEKLD